MAKQTFTTGQVLTAAQMTSLQQTAMLGGAASAKVASYVLVAADAGDAITMSNAGATTITVNTGLFATGDIVTIINIGTGTCTITAGTATVTTSGSLVLAQNQGGVLRFTSPSAAIFLQFATPASGDIEGVTAGTGISGGGTSGTVTITNSMATAIDAKGDLVPGTGADTFSRLAVGANGTVLTADSAEATGLKWAAASGGLTWAAGGSGNLPSASSLSLSISSKESVIIRISNMSVTADAAFYLRVNNSSSAVYDYNGYSHTTNTTVTTNYIKQINDTKFELNYPNGLDFPNSDGTWYIRVDGCKNGGFVSMYTTGMCKNVGVNNLAISFGGMFQTAGAVTSLDLILSSGSFDFGTYEWWAA
jgi:hypothetical protein